MPTPLTKLGTLRPLAHGWEALIRVDKGKRRGFTLTPFGVNDERGARERCTAMAVIALRVREAGLASELEQLLAMAARARPGKPWDAIVAAGDRLCAGITEPLSDAARVTVADLGVDWRSGKLHREHPDHVKAKDSKRDEEIARLYVDPVIGGRRVADLTLDDIDEVMSQVTERFGAAFRERAERQRKEKRKAGERPKTKTEPSPALRRHVAQYMRRLLAIAVYPCRLRPDNPIPKGWLPRLRDPKAKECLYPDEDRALLGCTAVPLLRRLVYGFLAREGMRAEEASELTWTDVDIARARVALDCNKTQDPRGWSLDAGVCGALAIWKEHFSGGADGDRVFAVQGVALDIKALAKHLRRDLRRAGVDRSKLFEQSATRQPIRAHDLRATFVTTALASGRTETWVADRTGHRSSAMINRYRRRARERSFGALDALDRAIPELAALAPTAPAPKASEASAKASEAARADQIWIMTGATGADPGSSCPEGDTPAESGDVADAELRDAAGPEKDALSRSYRLTPPAVAVSAALHGSIAQSVELRTFNPLSQPANPDESAPRDPNLIRSTAAAAPRDGAEVVEGAIARALEQAAAAGRFDVVAQLARELEARRLAAAGNVVRLESAVRTSRRPR